MSEIRRAATLVDHDMKGRVFRGLAAVFDAPWHKSLTEKFGYVEVVKRGAFRKALASGDNIPFLLEHNQQQLLGTTQSGNVKISEDAKGLVVEATLPENYLGEYARSLIAAGDMKGMSYGLDLDPRRDVLAIQNRYSQNTPITRAVVGAKRLIDVSLTWTPAYEATTVDLRSKAFVVSPLQEANGGTETQTVGAAGEESPGEEPESWWGESPAEAEEVPVAEEHVPAWERLARQIEREYQ